MSGLGVNSALAYRRDIDGLRAISVVLVVIYHAFPSALPGGFVGVDVFFVISGFLIGSIIVSEMEQGGFQYTRFLLRRVRRIMPALVLVLAATLAAGYFLLVPEDFVAAGRSVVAGSLFVANLLFWSESGYFDVAAESKPLLHLWSLAIEEQFYLLWPVLLWFAWRRDGARGRSLWAVALMSLALCLVWTTHDPNGAFYGPLTRFWELAAGTLLGLWLRGYPLPVRSRMMDWVAAAGLLLILASALLYSSTQPYPGWRALLPVAGTLMFLACADRACWTGPVMSNRLMVGVGRISYPLYLWHWPALLFAKHAGVGAGVFSLAVHQVWLVLALCVLLACLTYWLVERPIRRAQRWRSLWPVLGGWALVTVAGLAAWLWMGRNIDLASTKAAYMDQLQRRLGTCFVETSKNQFDPSCLAERGLHPSVLLVGDSYAAGFSRVLREKYGEGVSEYSASSCPLNFDYDDAPTRQQECRDINDQRRSIMLEQHFDVIFIASWWLQNGIPAQLDNLRQTVDFILANTRSRIVLYGPSPVFWSQVPDIDRRISSWWRDDAEGVPVLFDYRTERRQFSEQYGSNPRVLLVDPFAVWCHETYAESTEPETRCRIRDEADLLFIDNSHLSLRATRVIMERARIHPFIDGAGMRADAGKLP